MDLKRLFYLYIRFTAQWLLKDPMMQSVEKALLSDIMMPHPKEHNILCILMAGNYCDARQLFCSPSRLILWRVRTREN
jgi:hypothetical protein